MPDEQGQAEFRPERARREVLAEANSGTVTLGAALERLNEDCGPELLKSSSKKQCGRAPFRARALLKVAAENLRRALGLTEGRDMASIEREMAEDGIAPERWSELVHSLAKEPRMIKKGRICSGKRLRPIAQRILAQASEIASTPISPFTSPRTTNLASLC